VRDASRCPFRDLERDTLDQVIGLLLERETIDGSDLAAIVGPPGPASRESAGVPLTLT